MSCILNDKLLFLVRVLRLNIKVLQMLSLKLFELGIGYWSFIVHCLRPPLCIVITLALSTCLIIQFITIVLNISRWIFILFVKKFPLIISEFNKFLHLFSMQTY